MIEDLSKCKWSNANQRLGQSQKHNGTKDMSNGPWEATHANMGMQLVKLNEAIGKIFKVKNILKMFKNHVKRFVYRKMGHAHEG